MRPLVTRRRSGAAIGPATGPVERIGVVVPARNEAATIAGCLAALAAATAAVAVGVTAALVADSCSDDTIAIASAVAAQLHLDLRVASIGAGSVGRARATGMDVLLDHLGAPGTWLATTDADSAVPPHWLARQLAYATEGTALVAGTVSVSDWSAWPAPIRLRAEADYRRPGSRHVHGANLGFRAEGYRRVGGFSHRASDEDRALVDSFLAHGEPVVWAEDLPVCTSARRVARAPHGFASYLAALGTPVAVTP